MAEKEEVTYVPVSIEEVCDYKGFLVEEVEEDKIRTVDTSTGEIYDTPVTNRAANSVIHLRAAR